MVAEKSKKGKSLISRLREGGKMFPTLYPLDDMIPDIMKSINGVLSKLRLKLFQLEVVLSFKSGKMSGDLDMIVDPVDLQQAYNMPDEEAKVIRKKLRQQFDLAGFTTGQSGTSVHVEVPNGRSYTPS